MKFGYTIDTERKIIFLRFSGPFDLNGFFAGIERLWADPDYRREYEGVADISAVENTYTLGDLHRVISFLKADPRTNTSRWAVITASPLAVAIAYVYKKAMASVHKLEVFSTWEAASAYVRWEFCRPVLDEQVIR
jgi:hypothetical protein